MSDNSTLIKVENLSKRFGKVIALNSLSTEIPLASIYGVIGTNGAGKSTLLRLIAGVLRADSGHIFFNGQLVDGHAELRHEIVLVADQPCFLPGSSLRTMLHFFRSVYRHFDTAYANELLRVFPLDLDRPLRSMSKGMQRQANLILALSTRPQLLLLDEAFDGLDPVMRENLKRLLAQETAERRMTCVIASHNLRELEDFCDQIGLLHEGGLIYEHELDSMNLGVFKVQCAFQELPSEENLKTAGLHLLHYEKRASVLTLVLRDSREKIEQLLAVYQPLILDILPLTLEELFIYELEVKGYAVQNLLA